MKWEQLEFHEASLEGIKHSSDAVALQFEDISFYSKGEEYRIKGTVKIEEPVVCLRDDQEIPRLVMEGTWSEVLTLNVKENNTLVELLVEWNEPPQRWHETVYYELRGKNVSFRYEGIDKNSAYYTDDGHPLPKSDESLLE